MKLNVLGQMSVVAVTVLVLGLVLGIHLISNGIALGVLALLGVWVTWVRLPRWIKLFLTLKYVRWPLDAFISLGVPFLMKGTLTGAAGAFTLGVFITIFLEVQAKVLRRRPLWVG